MEAWEQKEEVVTDAREGEMIASHKFPIPADELIQRTKLYLAKNQYGINEPDMLAEDFEFVGQVIGPLDKATFIRQLGQFDLLVAFPDVKVRWHHFRVDPYDASRVWFTGRSMATNLGAVPPLISEATNKAYESPPEACSLRFNERGQVRLCFKLTVRPSFNQDPLLDSSIYGRYIICRCSATPRWWSTPQATSSTGAREIREVAEDCWDHSMPSARGFLSLRPSPTSGPGNGNSSRGSGRLWPEMVRNEMYLCNPFDAGITLAEKALLQEVPM